MKYVSTRGEAPELGFEDVLLAGLARDGGLYVPKTWPTLAPQTIAGFAGRHFHEVMATVFGALSGDAIPAADLQRMCREATHGFSHPAVTPLVQIDHKTFVMELFHGPTLAFKDVAMQLLARLMDYILEKRGQRATIVGATSGDTGGAAIEAFRTSKRVDVMILFPDGRVSDVQRRMMTTPVAAHLHAIAIDGTFDDAQARVKDMFNDHAFRDRVQLSGVNSINWARIAAQVSYYFVAAAALGSPHRKVTFAVPTGNFGDIFAGWVARRMGLPIDRLVIATNTNDILARAHASGVYETRAVVATASPSMDIQVSSNFERWLFEASGRDAGLVRRMMASLKQSGRFDLGPLQAVMQHDFAASGIGEREGGDVLRAVRDATGGYLVDPHTVCALASLQHVDERPDPNPEVPRVVLATAHPAKFPDTMAQLTGTRPPLPARLSRLMSDPEHITRLPNDLRAIESYVEKNARAVTGGVR